VRFHAEQRLRGSKRAIASLLADPGFYVALQLPDVRQPEVLESYQDGSWSVVRLRYAVDGGHYPILRLLASSAPLAWLQEVRVDPSAGSGQLRYEAEFDPVRLHGAGEFTLTSAQGSTIFRFEGDVTVAVPGIGRLLERQMIRELIHRLDIEAEALDAQLRRNVRGPRLQDD